MDLASAIYNGFYKFIASSNTVHFLGSKEFNACVISAFKDELITWSTNEEIDAKAAGTLDLTPTEGC